jgi:hypothetical protein
VNKQIVSAKNQMAVIFIAGGAAIAAIPIFVFCLTRLGVGLATSWAAPRAPVFAKKIRQLARTAEARISGQTDK